MTLTNKLSAWFILTSVVSTAMAVDISGNVGAEWREFPNAGQYNNNDVEQARHQFSISAEPEFAWETEDGKHQLVFKAFGRLDSEDDERSHADIREASWLTYGDDWELKAGISKVFWGVTESQHLVDIVNQTDFVEAPDGEEKLGQPMIKLSLIRDWGLIDAFILPGFRERTFAGEDGRFRLPLDIDTDDALYQSSEEEQHIDVALRWAHTLGDYDLGLSYFKGTSRDPFFVPQLDETFQPDSLTPLYVLIDQVGFDLQATLDSWLWKLETIYRSFDEDKIESDYGNLGVEAESFTALTGGFEYTFYDLVETGWDLGALTEYQYDSRDDATQVLGQNDVFMGGRLTLNDAESTEVLFGVSQDLDDQATRSLLLEAETRLGDSIKLNVEGLLFHSATPENLSYRFVQDDYVQVSLYYYY
ncbi:hypothetical protein [Bacterioplanoides sp.]|uniref:hypothetical protein n=1 Tax=Bacterioplanoides sp. TaxID=2066072 RepID=UPI003B006D24